VRDGTAEFEWIAEDPDPGETGDLKVWILYSQDGTDWMLLEEGIPNENEYSWNVSVLTDGNYSLKLIVSDCQPEDFNHSTEYIFNNILVNNIDDAPVIEFLTEGLGILVFKNEILLEWRGTDADGDGITYSLFYEKDGEEVWLPMEGAQDITDTSFLWDISDVEDGTYRIKIIAKENYTLGLEGAYITTEIRIVNGYTLGEEGEGGRSVTINYGLLFGLGAGFVILALILIWIMFFFTRKKEPEGTIEKKGGIEE
jgi:hypothetical protein